jgi:hypothetical protein
LIFTPASRDRVHSELRERAARDMRLTGGAITGSAAAGCEDRWSDIDLAFGVADAAQMPNVLADWTLHMCHRHLALHYLDVTSGQWVYRVFILPDTLQVDLAFVPATEVRALAPTFRLIFGTAQEPRPYPPPRPEAIVGLGWLYALHARSSIARGKLWRAEYMISGIRDHALALACLRHGLDSAHGRGIHLLPAEVTAAFEDSLVRSLDQTELLRAFKVVLNGLVREIRSIDEEFAAKLQDAQLAEYSD